MPTQQRRRAAARHPRRRRPGHRAARRPRAHPARPHRRAHRARQRHASSRRSAPAASSLDVEFSATRLRELAKMDGAIVVDRDATRILRAAVQLVPDPTHRDHRVRHPAPHRRAGRQADRLPGHLGEPVDADRRPLRRRPPRTCSRTPTPSCPAPTRRCDARALQVPPRRGHRHAVRARDRGPRHGPRRRRRGPAPRDGAPDLRGDRRLRRRARHRRPAARAPARRAHRRHRSDDRELVIRDYLDPRPRPATRSRRPSPTSRRIDSTELLDLGRRRPRASASPSSATRSTSSVSPRGYRLLSKVPRLPGAIVDRLVGALRRPAEAARRQHRRPHGRRRRRRAAGPAVREGLSRLAESSILERYV